MIDRNHLSSDQINKFNKQGVSIKISPSTLQTFIVWYYIVVKSM
jgi:hypothetical protein